MWRHLALCSLLAGCHGVRIGSGNQALEDSLADFVAFDPALDPMPDDAELAEYDHVTLPEDIADYQQMLDDSQSETEGDLDDLSGELAQLCTDGDCAEMLDDVGSTAAAHTLFNSATAGGGDSFGTAALPFDPTLTYDPNKWRREVKPAVTQRGVFNANCMPLRLMVDDRAYIPTIIPGNAANTVLTSRYFASAELSKDDSTDNSDGLEGNDATRSPHLAYRTPDNFFDINGRYLATSLRRPRRTWQGQASYFLDRRKIGGTPLIEVGGGDATFTPVGNSNWTFLVNENTGGTHTQSDCAPSQLGQGVNRDGSWATGQTDFCGGYLSTGLQGPKVALPTFHIWKKLKGDAAQKEVVAQELVRGAYPFALPLVPRQVGGRIAPDIVILTTIGVKQIDGRTWAVDVTMTGTTFPWHDALFAYELGDGGAQGSRIFYIGDYRAPGQTGPSATNLGTVGFVRTPRFRRAGNLRDTSVDLLIAPGKCSFAVVEKDTNGRPTGVTLSPCGATPPGWTLNP